MTPTPDLVSLVVNVRAAKPAMLPGHLGRAVQAVFYQWLAKFDPALAKHWHDQDGAKPYTCSSLVGGRRQGDNLRIIEPQHDCWFRLTGLSADISAALLSVSTAPPAEVELDGAAFLVESVTVDPEAHPWANTAQSEALAAPYLMARARAPRRLEIELVTATSFKSKDRAMPLPLPELVFGSLVDRWNAFTSIAVSSEVRAFCESGVGLNRFDIRSSAIPMNDGGLQIGSIGKVGFTALRYDRYWMSVLGMLADYAFYAGVGRSTPTGFGQARRTDRSSG